MAQYSKIIDGTFISTGVGKFINLPMLPDTIEIWNKTQWGSGTTNKAISAIGFAEDPAGYGYATAYSGATTLAGYALTTGAFSFISAGTYQYGPTFTITSITQAAAAVVTTSAPHGYSTGNVVLITQSTGMRQIAGGYYTVTVLSTTTFSIPVNSSGFAAAATAGFVKQLLYSDLYIPQLCYITGITLSSGSTLTTTITTAINHKFQVGQEVGFTIPEVQGSATAWGTVQLDTATYLATNGIVPQQAYVTAVTANTLTVNINSTGYTAFAYPTDAQAALGMTFPQVYAIGDANSGWTNSVVNPVPTSNLVIPGAFQANTRQGVMIGTGNGTTVLHVTSDVIRWRAIYPDAIQLNV